MSMYGKGEKKPKVMCGPSKTKQEFRVKCDINRIVQRYMKSGDFDHVTQVRPVFMDCTKIRDFRGMLHGVLEGQAAFDLLPAFIRKRFHYDAAEMVEFLQKPDNRKEAIFLGLIAPDPAPAAAAPAEAPKEPVAESKK